MTGARDGLDGDGAAASPAFLCDAMLGGLARWLRASGYDAEFEHGIDDAELVRRAGQSGQIVLSSDGGVFARNIVRSGAVRALYVPRGLGKLEQLGFVLRTLGLPVRDPRCMACSGALVEVAKEDVRDEAPRATFACQAQFWRCTRCGKLLWRGTHWKRIEAGLEAASGPSESAAP